MACDPHTMLDMEAQVTILGNKQKEHYWQLSPFRAIALTLSKGRFPEVRMISSQRLCINLIVVVRSNLIVVVRSSIMQLN